MVRKDQKRNIKKVKVNEEEVEEMVKFKYMIMVICVERGIGEIVSHGLQERREIQGRFKKMGKENTISLQI